MTLALNCLSYFLGSQSCSQIGWLNVNKWCIVFETKLCLLNSREFTFSESQLITQSRESTHFTHKKAFDKGMQSPFMRRAVLKQKNFVTYLWSWSKIAECRRMQLGSDWWFDSSAAKNSMKYFTQIWNVVSFTWQQFIVTVHTGTLAVGDWVYIWFYSIPTQRVKVVFLALSRL